MIGMLNRLSSKRYAKPCGYRYFITNCTKAQIMALRCLPAIARGMGLGRHQANQCVPEVQSEKRAKFVLPLYFLEKMQ